MSQPERVLVWLLRFAGVSMLLALVAVFMPFEWMNCLHHMVGLGELPHVPIVGYLTRSISGLYALHGALLLFVARNVPRYLPLIKFLAVASVVFGGIMLGLDLAVGMPPLWTIGEGPFVFVAGVAMLWLAGRVKPQEVAK